MRYYLDTEFMNLAGNESVCNPLDLISIGVVAEDGREYYAINRQMNLHWLFDNPFLVEHVVPHLPIVHRQAISHSPYWKTPAEIRDELRDFCDVALHGGPQFWTDCGAFDYVLVSQLFGDFTEWPACWPYYFGDLQQWADQIGVVLPPQPAFQHHALWDARHNRDCWHLLTNTPRSILRSV